MELFQSRTRYGFHLYYTNSFKDRDHLRFIISKDLLQEWIMGVSWLNLNALLKCINLLGGDVVFQCRDEGPLRAPVRWVREGGKSLKPGFVEKNGRLELFKVSVSFVFLWSNGFRQGLFIVEVQEMGWRPIHGEY